MALNSLISEIHTSTATMTSVPKVPGLPGLLCGTPPCTLPPALQPLKFLTPHIDALKLQCDQWPAGQSKQLLADIVSVLCTTVGLKEGVRDALKYRLIVRRLPHGPAMICRRLQHATSAHPAGQQRQPGDLGPRVHAQPGRHVAHCSCCHSHASCDSYMGLRGSSKALNA
jgi:hypothetical protein